MTVEEYHRAAETGVLGEDVELLEGIVITKLRAIRVGPTHRNLYAS